MVVYHGTPHGEFSVFSNKYSDQWYPKKGFYFAEEKRYAQNFEGLYSSTPKIYEVFLNIRNPFESEQHVDKSSVSWQFDSPKYRNNDGLYGVDTGVNTSKVWVVRNANQIKSASYNHGQFSSDDNNIYLNILK